MMRLYWYIRALFRFGVFNLEPGPKEQMGWLSITQRLTGEPRALESFVCRECGRRAWRIGRSEICDRYGCYVAFKMRKKVEVVQ
jgi:hypothetical protein